MSGHSKWATTKHRKGALDAKRGKIFTKIIREITVAARSGGGDPVGNARLKLAIQKGKDANMPADNIKKAVQRGTGEIAGVSYEAMTYEGYGPGGTAVMVEVLTDNKNRAVSEVRHIFSRYGGSIGEAGCVAWMFEKKGSLIVDRKAMDEDRLLALALEAGAEDVGIDDPTQFEVTTAPQDFESVKKALSDVAIPLRSSEITFRAKNQIALDLRAAESLLRLTETLDDNDDVQNVYTNADIPDDVMAQISTL